MSDKNQSNKNQSDKNQSNKNQSNDPSQNWNIALLIAVIIILIVILNFKFILNGDTTPSSNQKVIPLTTDSFILSDNA